MYTQFFGFSEKPFGVTPDPKFLFLTSSHSEALASMGYGITERKGFLSITGEIGTGKTTLIYSLIRQLPKKIKTVLIYHTNITFEQILKSILLSLKIPFASEDRIILLDHLREYLTQRLSSQDNLAIIIDEAQNLSRGVMEELRMLSNFETPQSKLLQIVLVGQPELEANLNAEELKQLKQRIGIRRQIRPLRLDESKKYIDHRLNLVGSNSSDLFTPEALSLICDYSKGIPRTINILCDNSFLIGYAASQKKINADIIREVIGDMEGSIQEKPPREEFLYNLESTVPPPRSTIQSPTVNGLDVSEQEIPKKNHVTSENIDFDLQPKKTIKRRPQPLFSRGIFFIVSLFCLILIILLGRGYFQKKESIKTAEVKTLNPPSIETNLSAKAPPVEIKTDMITPQELETQPDVSNILKEELLNIEGSKTKTVTAKKNDFIFALAKKHYHIANDTLADLILEANPRIKNINQINVDQRINLPPITEESLIVQSPDHFYKIYIGTFRSPNSVRIYEAQPIFKGKRLEAIERKVSPDETWYRILAGNFMSKEECLEAIRILKDKGLLPIFGKI